MEKVFLLDGHSLIHRAYYAITELKTTKGLVTNAVYGFTLMLMKLLEEWKPNYIGVAFDMEGPTFRHKRYEHYKATRDKTPEDLHPQFELVRRILKAYDIPIFEERGYEADDVIGTIAHYCQNQGLYTVIITGDRDALQLVNDQLEVLYTRKGITDLIRYDLQGVLAYYGLQPELLVDLKGLMGDPSDNIPGVDGIGEKTAKKLMKDFGTLEGVLENAHLITGKKRQENLVNQREQALMSRDLAMIRRDVPLKIHLKEMDRSRFKKGDLLPIFQELEFKNLIQRLDLEQVTKRVEIGFKKGEITNQEQLGECFALIKEKGVLALELIGGDKASFFLSPDGENLFSYHQGSSLALSTFLKDLKEVLQDSTILKYMAMAKEKLLYLCSLNIEVEGLLFEPALAAYLINPGGRINTFEELMGEYGLKLPKTKLGQLERLPYLFQLKEKMMDRLVAMDLEDLYHKVELPLVRVLVEMEKNGITVDKKRLKELAKDLGGRLLSLRMEACTLVGQEFNLNSPKQLGKVLFQDLKLPVIKKTKTGYSTAVDVLEELQDRHPLIPLILEYRQLMKLKSTYVDSLLELLEKKTNRIHTSFNQLVTATGRLSSTEPNLQNIPVRTEEGRKIREAFRAKEGDYLLLTADYSQVELRILAHISRDTGLKEAFSQGEDIHTNTAAKVFMVPMEEVTREHRRRAKAINFGIAYGMSAYGLGQDLDISREEAQAYIDSYFQRYPGVLEYMENTIKRAEEEGFVRTLLGRVRFLPDITSKNRQKRALAQRMAINTPIQGSAADIMKLAMVEVYRILKESRLQADLLLQVHDELVLEVKEEDLMELARLVKGKMEGAIELDVPLTVDLKVGKNWRDTKLLSMEEGS